MAKEQGEGFPIFLFTKIFCFSEGAESFSVPLYWTYGETKKMPNESELILNFSENIKRLIKGRVKSEIAKAIGKTRFQVYRYVNASSLPDVPTLKKLADIFHVTMDYLITYHENEGYYYD